MDYYSPIWGLRAISMTYEPQSAYTCHSSTLVVFVNSDQFHGLLLTVLGPKAISMVVEFQGALTCRSSTITVWADSGPFLGLLLYFGVLESFR